MTKFFFSWVVLVLPIVSFAQKNSSWLFDTLALQITQKYEFIKSDYKSRLLFGKTDSGLTIYCDSVLKIHQLEYAEHFMVEKIETTDKNCYIPGTGNFEHYLFEVGSGKITISCFDQYIYNIEIGNEFGKTIIQIPLKITDSLGGKCRINTLFINAFSNSAKLAGMQAIWYKQQLFSYNPQARQLHRRNIPLEFRRFFFYDRTYAFQFFYSKPLTPKGFYKPYNECGFSSFEITTSRLPDVLFNGNASRAYYKSRNHDKIMRFYSSGRDFISQ